MRGSRAAVDHGRGGRPARSLRRARGVALLVAAWLLAACMGVDDTITASGGSGETPEAATLPTGAGGQLPVEVPPPAGGQTGLPTPPQGTGAEPTVGSGGKSSDLPPPAGTVPTPEHDENVAFEWPETSPGDGSECQAGTYTGTFTCVFMQANSLFPVALELTGPISITLVESEDGEFLEITDGDFAAVANGFVGARAEIRGRLDCNTRTLAATAVDGMWAIGDPDLPVIPGGQLEGDITGTLDSAIGTLSGDWTFGDPVLGECPGTWSARYVP